MGMFRNAGLAACIAVILLGIAFILNKPNLSFILGIAAIVIGVIGFLINRYQNSP